MRQNIFFFLFLLALIPAQAQVRIVKGRVTGDFSELGNINVINQRTERFAVTDSQGYFEIQATPTDTLVFSAIHVQPKTVDLACEDLEAGQVYIRLQPILHQLKEVVVVRYPKINAVALGIITEGQKQYTPAERRLATASDPHAQIGLNTHFSLDPLLNGISGRTATLKKALETERKESWLDRIRDLYEDDFLVTKLCIPLDYVRGFQYFVVENQRFLNTLASKNKAMCDFLIGELAHQFIENLAHESK